MANLSLILHPLDLSGEETAAFAHAVRLSAATGAELHLLNVAHGRHGGAMDAFPDVGTMLDRWRSTSVDRDVLVTKSVERRGGAIDQIRHFVEEEHPDLVVLSPHQRHGLDRLLHASVSEALARDVPAMMLFVPRGGRRFVDAETGEVTLRRVLVPVARTPPAEPAVEAALTLARLLRCSALHLTLLHVGAPADFPELDVSHVSHVSRAGADVTVERVSLRGDVVDTIADASQGVDLVAMTTEGRTSLLDAIQGDTTEQLLRRVSCPVLAVPME